MKQLKQLTAALLSVAFFVTVTGCAGSGGEITGNNTPDTASETTGTTTSETTTTTYSYSKTCKTWSYSKAGKTW